MVKSVNMNLTRTNGQLERGFANACCCSRNQDSLSMESLEFGWVNRVSCHGECLGCMYIAETSIIQGESIYVIERLQISTC